MRKGRRPGFSVPRSRSAADSSYPESTEPGGEPRCSMPACRRANLVILPLLRVIRMSGNFCRGETRADAIGESEQVLARQRRELGADKASKAVRELLFD